VARKLNFRRYLKWAVCAAAAFYGWIALSLFIMRYVDPPTTAVQMERRVESWFRKGRYQKRYRFVDLNEISPALQHAVVAAEDARFFKHHGLDWVEIQDAVEDDLDGGRLRGASTITQQLVKNLFLTTRGSFVRKALEFTIVPFAEGILGKQRILELYLNVIEWGPGIFGAEAAAQRYYGEPAARINREEGARLAAILPNPIRRQPARMSKYSTVILQRMSQMGW